MDKPPAFAFTVDVTINVSFTDTIVGAMYADAPEAERRAMLLEAIEDLLNRSPEPVGREAFVTYHVVHD